MNSLRCKAVAIAAVMMLLVTGFAVMTHTSDDSSDDTIFDRYSDGMATVEELLEDPDTSDIISYMLEAGEYTDDEIASIMPMAIPIILVLVVGLGVGFGLGAWLHATLSGTTDSTTDEPQLRAELREMYAEMIQSNWENVSNIFAKLGLNSAQILSFTESYFANQAEITAAQLWNDYTDYSGDTILTASAWTQNMAIIKHNIQSSIGQFALELSSERGTMAAKSNTYGSMRMGWAWDNGDLYLNETTGNVWMALAESVYATQSSNRVYISVYDFDELLTNSNNLYVFGGSATIKRESDGKSFTLSEGINDAIGKGLTSDWYILEQGRTYVGNLLPSSTSSGLTPQAAMVLYSNGHLALVTKSGNSYSVMKDGMTNITSDVSLIITWPDAEDVTRSNSQKVGLVLDAYQAVIDQINHSAVTTTVSGGAAWIIFDQLEMSSSLIHPSAILTSMQTNTDVTAEVLAGVYAAAMRQLVIFGENVRPSDIKLSPESLDLVVYGDIYFRGQLIAQNAIYTPFVYLTDRTLHVGNQDWTGAGIAMVWATDVGSIGLWNGDMTNAFIIDLSEGYTMDTLDIRYKGEQVSSVTLTVKAMEYIGYMEFGIDDVLSDPEFSKVQTYEWAVIALVLTWMAIICFFAIRRPTPASGMIILLTIVIGGLFLLIFTGILQGWLGGIFDKFFEKLPFKMTGGLN